jgi:hypothetical protein
MNDPSQMVTVFRSADRTAEADASTAFDLLSDAGLTPALLNDQFPGVPVGCYEVRVPPDEEEQALDTLDQGMVPAEAEAGDPSHAFDLVEIYRGAGTTGEVESLSIRSVLDANHIPSVLVGTPQMPNLPFRVMVPAAYAESAQRVLDEASGEPAGSESAAQAE